MLWLLATLGLAAPDPATAHAVALERLDAVHADQRLRCPVDIELPLLDPGPDLVQLDGGQLLALVPSERGQRVLYNVDGRVLAWLSWQIGPDGASCRIRPASERVPLRVQVFSQAGEPVADVRISAHGDHDRTGADGQAQLLAWPGEPAEIRARKQATPTGRVGWDVDEVAERTPWTNQTRVTVGRDQTVRIAGLDRARRSCGERSGSGPVRSCPPPPSTQVVRQREHLTAAARVLGQADLPPPAADWLRDWASAHVDPALIQTQAAIAALVLRLAPPDDMPVRIDAPAVLQAADTLQDSLVTLARWGRERPASDLAFARGIVLHSRQTLVDVRVRQLARSVQQERLAQALDQADALLDLMHTLHLDTPTSELDPVRLELVRLARAAGDRERVLAYARDCRERCADPAARERVSRMAAGSGLDALDDFEGAPTAGASAPGSTPSPAESEARDPAALLRLRLGASWTVPAGGGTVDGLPIRQSALSGQVGLGWAPTQAGCAEVGAAWDAWSVPDHPDQLGQRRWRIQAGWCPALLVGQRGPLVAALRGVVGLGVAGGQILVDGAADRAVLGAGPFLRIEVPVRIRFVELSARVGWAPYGRGGERFVGPLSAGFGVAIGLPP